MSESCPRELELRANGTSIGTPCIFTRTTFSPGLQKNINKTKRQGEGKREERREKGEGRREKRGTVPHVILIGTIRNFISTNTEFLEGNPIRRRNQRLH